MEKMLSSAPSSSESNWSLLGPWNDVLAKRAGQAAIFSETGSVLRTFGEIEREAESLRDQLSGLKWGGVIGVQIGNSPSWPAVFLALLRLGAITVPLGVDSPVPEFAEALISTPELRISRLAPAAPKEELSGTALLKLTSGTTGSPRAIRFTADQLAADAVNICQSMEIRSDDVNYGVIPFAHSYGFSNLITPLILSGVALVASDDRMPRAVLSGLKLSRATVFPGTPVLFHHLASVPEADGHQVRLGISAGAPLSRAVFAEVRERTGIALHTFYGASECGGISYDRVGSLPEEGYVGTPMANVEVEVDANGCVEVRSAAVGTSYYPDADPGTLAEGRFRPADLVKRTEQGIILVGRVNDFINVGGRKINPVEVEQCLASIAGVRQVVVFGVNSRLRGEEPVACVVGEIDRAELLKSAARLIPAWQLPKDVWLMRELPVSERGKISRRALAERYMQERLHTQ